MSQERALLSVGSEILIELDSPTSVTGLWERFKARLVAQGAKERITFDWFALALSLLFALGLVERGADGRLWKVGHVSA